MAEKKTEDCVEIWTDGACLGNPGPGGWAAVLRYKGKQSELSGADALTTNNRMELLASIKALEALKRPSKVRLTTDSVYVREGITKWLAGWKQNNWKTASKKPVKNQELWQQLDEVAQRHQIEWLWVKGHSGQPENELCDQLARAQAQEIRAESQDEEVSAEEKTVKPPKMIIEGLRIEKLSGQTRFENWAQLYQGYAQFYQVPELTQEHLERVWGWLNDKESGLYGLIALDGQGKMLGLAHLRVFMRPLAGEYGLYLDDLFVIPQARGAGVGEALILAAANNAKQAGQGRIRWITDANNKQAQKLYDRIALKTNWLTYDYLID